MVVSRTYAIRGNGWLYGEAEYRFPLSSCGGIWGGVFFVNATTASNPVSSVKLFDSVKPGYGLGLRLWLTRKHELTSLLILVSGTSLRVFTWLLQKRSEIFFRNIDAEGCRPVYCPHRTLHYQKSRKGRNTGNNQAWTKTNPVGMTQRTDAKIA